MSAALSVVIPTLNEAAHLPALLRELMAARGLMISVIISDGGSTDDTLVLAAKVGARIVTGASGRGGQLRRGIAAAEAPWILLLHADSSLLPGWDATLCQRLSTQHETCAYYGKLRFESEDPRARLLEFGVALRCALFRLPYGDQGLLIHSDLLAAVGGMPDAPLMEDVILASRLGRKYLAPMNLTVRTDASAYIRDGWLLRAGKNLWRLLCFIAGRSAARLAEDYRR
ncbi:glycosyltransferase [Acidocella aquatica]|nr:glycosyltransferase [Acidocella aquatica]